MSIYVLSLFSTSVVFKLLVSESSFYILSTSPFPNRWFANISQSVTSLHSLSRIFCKPNYFDEARFIISPPRWGVIDPRRVSVGCAAWFAVCMCCETMPSVSLVNMSAHRVAEFFPCGKSCLVIAIRMGVKWHFVVLICISLATGALEHLFMYLLAICMSSLEECLFRSSARFFEQVVLIFAVDLLSWR